MEDGSYVFVSTVGTPVEGNHVAAMFHKITQRAGLRTIRFHELRHSAASILIAMGVHSKAIQALLRHSSHEITMNLYGHLSESVHQETADKMDVALCGTKG
jgi:integrase